VKRTPWLSWRLYFLTIPIDVIVLLLSGDHASTQSNDFLNWAILSLLAHASIAPFTLIALFFTSKINNWKSDLFALFVLGSIRGVAINVGFEILDLEPRVSSLYKVVNSAISLPLWFIGIAIFVESRRQYQREFEAIFFRSVRKEQISADKNLDMTVMGKRDQIKHLQSVTSDLAREIEGVISQSTSQSNYVKQTLKIQDLINKELRPTSAQLWNSLTLSKPKLSISVLIRISLLEQKLKVTSASLFFSPYIFIGLNGSQGWKFAFVATLLATCLNILIFYICEFLHKNGVLNRKSSNIAILSLSFLLPLMTILFMLPEDLFWTDSVATTIVYQLFLTSCHILLLLGFNLYKLLGQQRFAVIENLEQLIQGKEFSPISSDDLTAARDIDLARYLHGELQAGLIATNLLLERASTTGDADLARHALRSAVELLNQDHALVSQTRISSPKARLEKISSGWRGIADVKFTLDWIDSLDTSTLNDVIVLIDEGVSNAIRHAQSTTISVDGILTAEFLDIEIVSDGTKMTNNAAGLGTKLFDELALSWNHSRNGESNLLKFKIRIQH
jgi:signal transduction histidine kinase